LDLRCCEQVGDAGLAHLAALTSLSHLDLRWCKQVGDAGLAHLTALNGLSLLQTVATPANSCHV
jgi:F-box and leucine-rich repeat protein 14